MQSGLLSVDLDNRPFHVLQKMYKTILDTNRHASQSLVVAAAANSGAAQAATTKAATPAPATKADECKGTASEACCPKCKSKAGSDKKAKTQLKRTLGAFCLWCLKYNHLEEDCGRKAKGLPRIPRDATAAAMTPGSSPWMSPYTWNPYSPPGLVPRRLAAAAVAAVVAGRPYDPGHSARADSCRHRGVFLGSLVGPRLVLHWPPVRLHNGRFLVRPFPLRSRLLTGCSIPG